MIEAGILLDSVNDTGHRLTTWLLQFPRFILAEFNTHRMLSRNAASSRAIPVAKMIERAENDPAMPVWWGKNEKGMQAQDEIADSEAAKSTWLAARDQAVLYSRLLFLHHGLHKQISNRLLEPFLHVTVIASATEWVNFFRLRAHPDAQPEFRSLAEKMLTAYRRFTPKHLAPGCWHLPLLLPGDEGLPLETQKKISTARCARISYLTYDGRRDIAEDLRLHDRLVASRHWSPFEHCAESLDRPERIGNFMGWRQYRKEFPDEDGLSGNLDIRD